MKQRLGMGLGGGSGFSKKLWLYSPLVGGDITVKRDSSSIWIMTAIGSIVGTAKTFTKFQWKINTQTTQVMQFQNGRILTDAVTVGSDSATETAVIGITNDDENPIYPYPGEHVGGNHGWAFLSKVVKTDNHGLTFSDIGTAFTDDNGKVYYLVMIDGTAPLTTCYFMQTPTGTSGLSATQDTMTGTLTQEAPGGKTVVATNRTQTKSTQLTKIRNATTNTSLNNLAFQYLLNGVTPLASGVTTTCKTLVIIESYNICHPANELAYIVANKGTFEDNPTWNYTAPMFTVTNRYVFGDYGTMNLYTDVRAFYPFTLGYIGGTQAFRVTPNTTFFGATAATKAFLPNCKSTPDIDIDYTLQPFPSSRSEVDISVSNAIDTAKPINRIVQVAYDGADPAVPKYGRGLGYSETLPGSSDAERLANCTNYLKLSTQNKTYMQAYGAAINAQNMVRTFKTNAYWSYFSAHQYGTCNIYWRNEKNYCLVYIDYHKPATETITLPSIFNGKNWTLVSKSTNMAITGTLPSLDVEVSGTEGSMHEYAIIKVS